jgi:hypothetical protein
VSQPLDPGVPPQFQPPVSYGGYGGDLQSYGQQAPGGYRAPAQPRDFPPPPAAVVPVPLAGASAAVALPQRPAVIGLATTLAATASLQWMGVLSLCWLLATAGVAQLSTTGIDGGVYHVLSRFSYRMIDGLAWPLYLFPLASVVLSFLLLTRQPWTRLAFSATGAAALLWSAWWLRSDLLWWLVPAGYIGVTVLVLWTAEASRWYRWRPASDPTGQPR